MAIPFMMASVISAGWPEDEEERDPRTSSVVAASAYAGRRRLTSSATRETYDCRSGHGQVLHKEVVLPKGADLRFKQPGRLWSAAEREELVFDRQTKTWRFRKGAELGRRYILALPSELTLQENIELVREFVQGEFVDRGLAAEIVIHPSDDPKTGNIHAHVLVTSRPIEGKTFGNRATETRPEFICAKGGKGFVAQPSYWPQHWAAFQERFFAEHGIPLSVDLISICPRQHVGRAKYLADSNAQSSNRVCAELEQKLLRDPEKLLKHLSERLAVFSVRDIERLLRKTGVVDMEARRIVWKTLDREDVVALDPPDGGNFKPGQTPKGQERASTRARTAERRFTTRAILEQEQRIRAAVRTLADDPRLRRPLPPEVFGTAERLVGERGLDAEQAQAVRHCLNSRGLAQVQGRAGAGKSYAAIVVVEALASAGYGVVGLAPTNAVAGMMRKDGYPEGLTLHRFLLELERARRQLDSRTVLMVDEAAMVDVGIYERLMTVASQAGCRVVLIGDDRQLPPVGRGGAYSMIRRLIGAVEMQNIRRQRLSWMREASVELSQWNISPAIRRYNQNGRISWTNSLDQAMDQLVQDWGDALRESPDKPMFVYAGTNAWVEKLNRRLQQERWFGRPWSPQDFTCHSGPVQIQVGERLQFRANEKNLGIFNGMLATVEAIDGAGIHVRCDDGTQTSFDPKIFEGWDLGYAGTCYRGQGKTQDRTFLLYDHRYVWGAATTYVGLTRHRDDARLYVPRELAWDEETLIRQMSRSSEPLLASDHVVCADQEGVKDELYQTLYPVEPPIHLPIRLPDGRRGSIDIVPMQNQEAALAHFGTAPVEEFVPDYRTLDEVALRGPENGPAELLRRQAAGQAKKRGFRPGSGTVDPTCLRGFLSDADMDDHERDPRLRGDGKREIDVEPLAFHPDSVQESIWTRVAKRLRQLDSFVLDAVLARILALRGALAQEPDVMGALGPGAYLVKMARAIKQGLTGAELAKREREIRAEEPARRLVWKSFRLWRKDADGEFCPLPEALSHPARAFADVMSVPKWNPAEIQEIEADERAAILGGAAARSKPREAGEPRAGAAR